MCVVWVCEMLGCGVDVCCVWCGCVMLGCGVVSWAEGVVCVVWLRGYVMVSASLRHTHMHSSDNGFCEVAMEDTINKVQYSRG